jgi:hypothetical protein
VCKSVTDGKSIIIEGDLINHAVFDHLKMIADKAIWIPLLLVIKDCQIHQELLYREKDIEFERIRDWQDRLMKANAARDLDENTFHVIEVDVEDIQRTIDKIQSIVLDRIAHAVEAN